MGYVVSHSAASIRTPPIRMASAQGGFAKGNPPFMSGCSTGYATLTRPTRYVLSSRKRTRYARLAFLPVLTPQPKSLDVRFRAAIRSKADGQFGAGLQDFTFAFSETMLLSRPSHSGKRDVRVVTNVERGCDGR